MFNPFDRPNSRLIGHPVITRIRICCGCLSRSTFAAIGSSQRLKLFHARGNSGRYHLTYFSVSISPFGASSHATVLSIVARQQLANQPHGLLGILRSVHPVLGNLWVATPTVYRLIGNATAPTLCPEGYD